VAAPYGIAEFDILFAEGISREGGLIDLAEGLDIVSRAGAYYSYGDIRVQGKEKLRQLLKENPALADEIDLKIRSSKVAMPTEAEEEEDEELELGVSTN
jgi:recombination protein RecA